MGSLLKFYVFAIRPALVLALAGQLKSCTQILMGKAAQKTQRGVYVLFKIQSRALALERVALGKAQAGHYWIRFQSRRPD